MNKAVAKVTAEEKALAEIGGEFDVFDDANELNSAMGQDDLALPFMRIIQSNSPEVIEGDAKYIEAAKAGMFVSKVDRSVFDGKKGIELISCAHDRRFVEWKPRGDGGGRIRDFPADHPIQQEIEWRETDGGGTKPFIPNGNLLVETSYHYVLFRPLESDEPWNFAIIPCSGTMLKKSKAMNSQIAKEKMVDPRDGKLKPLPRWIRKWTARTVLETKDDNRWYNIEFEKGERVSDRDTYQMGLDIAQQFKAMAFAEIIEKEGDDDIAKEAQEGQVIDADLDDVPFE